MLEFIEFRLHGVAHNGFGRIAHRFEIGDEIGALVRGKAEIEMLVEIVDHLVVAIEAPVVEIGRVEIGVDQRRRLVWAAAADVVKLMIDEGAVGPMA